jgi:DNA-directed RNA polymerase specialized sigma24 family protein
MRHIKEILRLKTISGLSNRQIANACNISFDNGIEIS